MDLERWHLLMKPPRIISYQICLSVQKSSKDHWQLIAVLALGELQRVFFCVTLKKSTFKSNLNAIPHNSGARCQPCFGVALKT